MAKKNQKPFENSNVISIWLEKRIDLERRRSRRIKSAQTAEILMGEQFFFRFIMFTVLRKKKPGAATTTGLA